MTRCGHQNPEVINVNDTKFGLIIGNIQMCTIVHWKLCQRETFLITIQLTSQCLISKSIVRYKFLQAILLDLYQYSIGKEVVTILNSSSVCCKTLSTNKMKGCLFFTCRSKIKNIEHSFREGLIQKKVWNFTLAWAVDYFKSTN